MSEPRAGTHSLRSELTSTAMAARARSKEQSEKAAAKARSEHDAEVEDIARKFLDARTEYLVDILRDKAAKGGTEVEVWTYNQLAHSDDSAHHQGTLKGLQLVADWLRERDIDTELVDSGGEMVPDYGYVHTHKLTARWPQ